MDQASYGRFNRAPTSIQAQLIDACEVEQAPASADAVAWIKLCADGSCPFLAPDGWCSVQQAHGERLLPDACVQYPRSSVLLGEQMHRGGSLSCPEMARLALLDPRALSAAAVVEPPSVRLGAVRRVVPGSFGPGALERHAVAIRTQALRLLQREGVSLDARLLALGMVLRSLNSMEAVNRQIVEQVFEKYGGATGLLEEQIASLRPHPELALEFLRELTLERLKTWSGHAPARYGACVARIAGALSLDAQQPPSSQSAAAFEDARQRHYQPFIEVRGHLLANFVLNHLWTTSFPFAAGRSIFDNYMLLLVRLVLVRSHLIGISAYHHGLTDEQAIEVIQSLERAIDHDHGFLTHLLELLKGHEADSMAFAGALLVA